VSSPDHSAFLEPNAIPAAEQARLLSLEAVMPFLASPDTMRELEFDRAGQALRAGRETFPIRSGLPLLFPARLQSFLSEDRLEIPNVRHEDALLQYSFLATVKQNGGPANTDPEDVNRLKHVYRARLMARAAAGTLLDIGCDSPTFGKAPFPATVDYIGLDSLYVDKHEFRLIGMAEFLPFRDSTLDNVAFMASLDHILDYHRAIDEARRVLRPGGKLFLVTLVWVDRAQLFHDHVHFHHFREFEIFGALSHFSIDACVRYQWRSDNHRFALYLTATKRG